MTYRVGKTDPMAQTYDQYVREKRDIRIREIKAAASLALQHALYGIVRVAYFVSMPFAIWLGYQLGFRILWR